MKSSAKIVLVVIIWGILYFLVIWRLPYCYQVNQIKLPEKCKDITTKAGWTDVYVSHIAMGRMFRADTTDTDALWNEILQNNKELWEDIQKLPKHMNRFALCNLGETSWESWSEDGGISAGDFYGMVDEENADYYYVLKYNVDFGKSDAVMILAGGIISMFFVGFITAYLMRRILKKTASFH